PTTRAPRGWLAHGRAPADPGPARSPAQPAPTADRRPCNRKAALDRDGRHDGSRATSSPDKRLKIERRQRKSGPGHPRIRGACVDLDGAIQGQVLASRNPIRLEPTFGSSGQLQRWPERRTYASSPRPPPRLTRDVPASGPVGSTEGLRR